METCTTAAAGTQRDADIARYDRAIFGFIDAMGPSELRDFIDGIESRGRGGWWDECAKRACERLDTITREFNADYTRYVLIEQGYAEFVGTTDEQVRDAFRRLGVDEAEYPDDGEEDEAEEPERWDSCS